MAFDLEELCKIQYFHPFYWLAISNGKFAGRIMSKKMAVVHRVQKFSTVFGCPQPIADHICRLNNPVNFSETCHGFHGISSKVHSAKVS